MNTSGEISAIGGYYRQYDITAWEIYSNIVNDKLEWVHLAAKDVGNLDDILIGLKDKVLACQVKDKVSSFTYSSLLNTEENLLKKMFKGWTELKLKYPRKTIDVRLITTQSVSDHDSIQAYLGKTKPSTKSFVDNYWNKVKESRTVSDSWKEVTNELTTLLECKKEILFEFIIATHFSFNYSLPKEEDFNSIKWKRIVQDTNLIRHFIFDIIGKEKQSVFLTTTEFLNKIGLRKRLNTYFQHDFFVDEKHYQPIKKSISQLNTLTERYKKGYIGLVGSAGSGKSTLLTKWLQQSNDRVIKYFSFVNQDMTYDAGYRGESKYFLHDLITQIRHIRPEFTEVLPGADRTELIIQLREELIKFSHDYRIDGKKTFIVVDGLDHIEREQYVEYSLLKDLPIPESIPEGVFFILGSRSIDGLKDLNANIKLAIERENRLISIAPLTKIEVSLIIKSYAIIDLEEKQLETLSINSHGHPLFLRYTIERLLSNSAEEYNKIIGDQIFTGNILDEYQKYWISILEEAELRHVLSIISRLRFSFIDLEFLEETFAFSDVALSKFITKTRHFFYEAEMHKWQYFHNSFKWFLKEWTAQLPLTGKFNEKRDEHLHNEIAERIRNSKSNYRWNIIYHLFKAKKYKSILDIGTQDFFRTQWYQFRNYKFIYEDISLAAQAAYHEKSIPTWIRYLLSSSEISQRIIDFDPADNFKLYLYLGMQDVADSYIFNGRKLLIRKDKAFEYVLHLIHRGDKKHALKIFELAEPVFILNYSKEVDRNRYDSDSYSQVDEITLIEKWAEAAIYFYPFKFVISTIKSLNVKDGTAYYDKEDDNKDQELKNELLSKCYLVISDSLISKEDWKTLEIILDAIQKDLGISWTLLNIIRTILFNSSGFDNSVVKRATSILENWNNINNPDISIELSIIYAYALRDLEKAKYHFTNLPSPHLKLEKTSYRYADFEYLFDYTRLSYIFSKDFNASFEKFLNKTDDEDVQILYRHTCSIARSYALVYHGQNIAINDITITLKNILFFFHKGFMELDYKIRELKPEVIDLIITICRKADSKLYQKAIDLIAFDWTHFFEFWDVDAIRTIIDKIAIDNEYHAWGIEQLKSLEKKMLTGKRVGERAVQCIKQAHSWLRVDNPRLVESNLREAFSQTIGIRGEKDYQFDNLTEWLKRVNTFENDQIQERISWYLKRIDFVQSTTSHAHSYPALQILRICLNWHAGNGLGLLKWLLLNKVISFSDGLEVVLEYLVENDKENSTLYAKLFTRILLFFQDGSNYGYYISKDLVNNLQEVNSIKSFVNDIAIYGIEEKRNNVIRYIIEACEIKGIKIGISKDEYPVKDTYSSNDTYKNLHLDTGESLTPSKASEVIKTVDQALDLMQKESDNSYFDWTQIISNLKSQLTEEKIISILRSSEFDSRKLAKVGVIANEIGCVSLAKEIGFDALSKSRSSGWFKIYDGGTKLDAYQLLLQVDDKNMIRDLAFRDLAFTHKELDQKRIIENIFPILDIIAPEYDLTKIYEEVEIYSTELMKNAEINEDIFNFTKNSIDITELTSSLMHFLYEFPVSHMKEHIETLVIEESTSSPKIINHFLDQLYYLGNHEGYITILTGILNCKKELSPRHLPYLKEILNADRFDLMEMSYNLLKEAGNNIKLKFRKAQLPLIYEIEFDSKPELIVDNKSRLKEIEKRRSLRDTNDPLEYILYYKAEAKWISSNTGIPEINIAYRIMQIAEKEKLPEWYNGFPEQELANLFNSIDLNMPYIRPRVIRLWPALMKVVSELFKSGYLPFEICQYLSKQIDTGSPNIVLNSRLPEIPHLTDEINDIYRRRSTNEDWVKSINNECFDKFMQKVEGKHIIAEMSYLKSLSDGRASELRESFISLNKICKSINHYLFEGNNYNSYISEYLSIEKDEIIIFNHNQTFDIRKLWLAINPKICLDSGWTLSSEGNFRWIDSMGNIMVESIYWQDGNWDNYERLLDSETGYGWHIVASSEAVQTIKLIINRNLYLHQKCTRTYKAYQRRFNNDIDSEKHITRTIKFE